MTSSIVAPLVIVVDDIPRNRTKNARAFESRGCRVIVASNYTEAEKVIDICRAPASTPGVETEWNHLA